MNNYNNNNNNNNNNKPHRSTFFDVRVCHPNAISNRDLEPQQIYRIYDNEKKRLYSRRVLDIEHGTFTPLVFNTCSFLVSRPIGHCSFRIF